MAKYYGAIGFGLSESDAPGVYAVPIEERKYVGDISRIKRRWENGEHLNDDLVVNNMVSIIPDKFAFDHFFAIRYVNWMGVRWKVTNVTVQPPRLVLELGGVYNGPGPTGPSDEIGGTP